jgi:hypothetical protein
MTLTEAVQNAGAGLRRRFWLPGEPGSMLVFAGGACAGVLDGHIMRHPDGRRTTVPVHAGRDIRPGTLRNILRDTSLTVDDRWRLL